MKNWAALLLLSGLTTALFTNCRFAGKWKKGNGEVTTESRPVGDFAGVSSYGSFDVYVTAGSPASVKIEGESNLLPYIETYIEDNVLKVQTKEDIWLRPRRSIKVFVTAPHFKKIYSSGTGDIIGQTPITDSSRLDVHVRGNGTVKLELDAPEITAVLTGNGGMELKGQSKKFDCKLQGNGNLKAFNLLAEETTVNILGNGDAEVYASVKLNVSVGGNGNVKYKGNAQPSTHITGNGNISRAD